MKINNLSEFKFIVYCKGIRGLKIISSLVERNFIPILVVLQTYEKATINFLEDFKIAYLIEGNPNLSSHTMKIQSITFDLLVCAGYSKILGKNILDCAKIGNINCHGGKLPQYRGASPIPWQIINGETSGSAYVIEMTDGIDDGAILASEDYEIYSSDTATTITLKVVEIFQKLMPEVIQKIADNHSIPKGITQDEHHACRWTRRYPKDGKISWNLDAYQIVNLVRALNDPYPGAFFFLRDEVVVVRKARVFEQLIRGIPGRCVGKNQNDLLIICNDRAIALEIVEVSNQTMNAASLNLNYGESLEE